MKEKSDHPPFRSGPVLLLGAAGMAGLLASFGFRGNSYWSSLLIEVGAGLLLFGGLYWFQRRFVERNVDQVVRQTTAPIREEVRGLRDEVTTVRSDLDALSARASEVVDSFVQEHEDAFERFESEVSANSAVDILRRALDLNAVSQAGVRVRIPRAYYWLGFRMGEGESIVVTLENRGGEPIKVWTWDEELTVEIILGDVSAELMRREEYSSAATDGSELLGRFLKTVAFGTRVKTARTIGSLYAPLIELPNDRRRKGSWPHL